MTSTPLKPNPNPLKRSRPILSPFSQNVTNDPQVSPRRAHSPRADLSMKSPSRKKRKDPNLENRTPERESNRSRGSSRRSATPDVRYEPPSEKFTPPRNVVLQVSSVKSTKGRLSTPVSSSAVGAERKVVVKLERSMSPFPLPPIDLTKPPPPPSPTDDPLLLLETPITIKQSEDTIDTIMEDNVFDSSTSNLVTFDPDSNLTAGVFDSDDQSEGIGEAEGEFTGRFKFYKTPVKDDPPSSATKRRRESWGRPVSPHPRKVDQSWGDSDEEDPDSPPMDTSLNLNLPGQVGTPVTRSPHMHMIVDDEDAAVDDEFVMPGLVEVSSEDPRAAARAAAILKLHHSYIIDGISTKQPRRYQSPSVKLNESIPLVSNQLSNIPSPGERYQTRSPSVSYGTLPDDDSHQSGQEWTKACWKMLDTCFTDERFAVAEALGKMNVMASVDDIRLESVIERFIAQCNDTCWDRAMLLRRAQVLSNRQRSGRGAPRSVPPPQPYNGSSVGSVPPMLLAPRYAYLRDELCSTKSSGKQKLKTNTGDNPPKSRAEPSTSNTIPFPIAQTPEPERVTQNPPQSGAKKMLSYLGSFLGRYSPKPSPISSKRSVPPLPAPPEMRQLNGPISTPMKMAMPKEVPPKELVQLTEVIPMTAREFEKLLPPKDMVHLNHVEPPPSVRPRAKSNPLLRSSGGSVKDLVKCFEEVVKRSQDEAGITSKQSLRKTASVSNLNARSSWKL